MAIRRNDIGQVEQPLGHGANDGARANVPAGEPGQPIAAANAGAMVEPHDEAGATRKFIHFLTNIWGVLAVLSPALPWITSKFSEAVPTSHSNIQDFLEGRSGLTFVPTNVMQLIATAMAIYFVLATWVGRAEVVKKWRAQLHRRSYLLLCAGVAAIFFYWGLWLLAPALANQGLRSGRFEHSLLYERSAQVLNDLPLVGLYVSAFTCITRAFMHLALVEYFRPRGV